jgi:hypothetical protein
MFSTRNWVLLGLVVAAFVVFSPRSSAQTISCSSDDGRRHYCPADTRGGVRLLKQRSDPPRAAPAQFHARPTTAAVITATLAQEDEFAWCSSVASLPAGKAIVGALTAGASGWTTVAGPISQSKAAGAAGVAITIAIGTATATTTVIGTVIREIKTR